MLISASVLKNHILPSGRLARNHIGADGNHSRRHIGVLHSVDEGSDGFPAQKFFIDRKGSNFGAERRCLRNVVKAYDQRVLRDAYIQAFEGVADVARHEIVTANKTFGLVFQL